MPSATNIGECVHVGELRKDLKEGKLINVPAGKVGPTMIQQYLNFTTWVKFECDLAPQNWAVFLGSGMSYERRWSYSVVSRSEPTREG